MFETAEEAFENYGYSRIRPYKERPVFQAAFSRMAKKAGMENPEIYIGDLPDPEASGYINSFIVSKSLARLLDDNELAAVVGRVMETAIATEKQGFKTGVVSATGIATSLGVYGLYKWQEHVADKKYPNDPVGREADETFSRRNLFQKGGVAAGAAVFASSLTAHLPFDLEVPQLVEDPKALASAHEKIQAEFDRIKRQQAPGRGA